MVMEANMKQMYVTFTSIVLIANAGQKCHAFHVRSQAFVEGGRGGGGGGCERGQSGPSYRNVFTDCLVSRLFQGAFRMTPTRKTRQGLQKSTPSA